MFLEGTKLPMNFQHRQLRSLRSRRYLYSLMALGQKTSQHDCKANTGNFLAKNTNKHQYIAAQLLKNDRNQKNLRDLKAQT